MGSSNWSFMPQALGCKLICPLFWLATGLLILACSQSTNRDTKFEQYYVQGEQLYIKNCSNCHQKNGAGLGLVYPPVNTSDYVDSHPKEVFCLMKYGVSGELIVNGKNFNKPMKGIASLTELEVAEIATYLFNTWGRQRGIIEIGEVTSALKECEN